jgi:hypothetical protein
MRGATHHITRTAAQFDLATVCVEEMAALLACQQLVQQGGGAKLITRCMAMQHCRNPSAPQQHVSAHLLYQLQEVLRSGVQRGAPASLPG